MTAFRCRDERRQAAVRATGIGNGIDFLEVSADQRELRVHFLRVPSADLRAIADDEVRVVGGVRVTGIRVEPPLTFDGDVLVVKVSRPGDFSPYVLELRQANGKLVADLDPQLSAVQFTFKVDCPNGFDCAGDCGCHHDSPPPEPDIDYLAFDYASFRRLMLDRMAVTTPGWTERNPADLGVTLVEVLAYAADRLAYQLDATGTEATLATARQRTSVRRHARLVDYRMHDGANARTWVHVEIADGTGEVTLDAGTPLLTRVPTLPRILREAPPAGPVVFETMAKHTFRDDLNRFGLYAWGNRECRLPAGSTSASLRGRHDRLRAGDVLVFVEERGAVSGNPADADPARRHAVRIARLATVEEPLGVSFGNPAGEVTEIHWVAEDALPFDLVVSATDEDGVFHDDLTGVLGNIVLADHGSTRTGETFPVPSGRFAPVLAEPGLTMTGTIGRPLPGGDPRRHALFDPSASAAAATRWGPRKVLPAITLTEPAGDDDWVPRRDLLGSNGFAAEFVAETGDNGTARLRFGDGEYGMAPRPGSTLVATYRTGNGRAGNIGADTLWHVVTAKSGITAIRNPLPATGGTDPEPAERVRQDAPVAYRVPQRAVTADDYAAMARRHPEVQRAVCTRRWTGSWPTMFLTVDRAGGLPVDAAFELDLRAHLEPYRMAGHDLEIMPPRQIPLEVALRVCVLPEHYRSDVAAAVLAALVPGVFRPNALTFGTPVYLSAVLAAAQAVAGVRYVEPLIFERLGAPATSGLESGVLTFATLEIPRLDNDPNFADHGTLRLEMEGGR